MTLETYKSLWGMTGSLEEQFSRISAAGYDGIECAAQEIADPKHFRQLLEQHGMKFIALVYSEGSDHIAHFREVVLNAMSYGPEKIVAHGGRDTMIFSHQVRFLATALNLEDEIGIPIAHETHRRRPLFSPMNALAIFKELPDLKLNIDFSHWCCVTESMLEDHADAITEAARRSEHLHGRVGYENGPQVPDPRVEEWQRCVIKHETWWDEVIRSQRERGNERFTLTPEYGPPTYMQTIPATGELTADLWDVCLWTNERFKAQFARTNL
jgi:sugar phosphate isomerase/epimerase